MIKKTEESIEGNIKQKYPFADEMLTTIRMEYETESDRDRPHWCQVPMWST